MRCTRSRLLCLALLLLPLPTLAAQERLSVSQASDGSVVIMLSGIEDCSGAPAVLPPTVSVVGASISLDSQFGVTAAIVCGPADPTFPYSLPANVGHLADGNYTATWSFTPPALAPLSTSFAIGAGALGPIGGLGVPTLSPWALVALALLVVGSAYAHARYIPRKGPSP